MYKRIGKWLVIFLITFGLVTCSSASTTNITTTNTSASDTKEFRIWWPSGFLTEENTLVAQIVDGWQKESGIQASLTLVPTNLLDSEVVKSVEKGNPPDFLYSTTADTNLFPSLAWNNQLADVSDVINPIKDSYLPVALQTVHYQNAATKKRSYYAAPIGQQTVHIFYWRNLLEEAGFKDADIPKNWNEYWRFWQKVQENLRAKRGVNNIYSLGLPMSDLGTDTFLMFEEFLEAYGVKVVDDEGKLILDNSENRTQIVKALKNYTGLYIDGYVPPKATEWSDSGNNISLLEGQSVMTMNGTLSIPLTQKLPKNKYNEISNDLYVNKIVTADLPNRPDGSELKSILGIKQVVIFEHSKNKDAAKSFMKYLLRPEILGKFIREGSKGRMVPVMPQLLEDAFWKEADPHFPPVINQLLKRATRQSYEAINPAYSNVLGRNIWAKAILSVVKDKVSPEQATDKAIAQIVDIFAQWK
ncbi:MAG: ABC transporter substrate-binding protein [Pseudanabaena sp.]|jgi:multiple sugar transport system substrate-binding protein